jgi:GNAT superfamily N-acetyltransferase
VSIGDDTLLTMPDGMQASVKSLAAIGAITRNPDGSYSEKPQAAQGDPEEANEADFERIPEEAMDYVNAALDPLPQEMLNGFAAAGVAVAVAVGRGDLSGLAEKFAREAGGSLEDATARVEALAHVYRFQTMKAIERMGVGKADAEGFFDWCRANKQGAMSEAISYQLHQHNVSRWAPLVRQYLGQVAPSTESLKAAGLPVRKSAHKHGQTEVFIAKAGGGWMSPQAAARAGLI